MTHPNTHICAMQGVIMLRVEIQSVCWTMVSCINHINHRLRPKRFVEVLSMKCAPCHLLDGPICMLITPFYWSVYKVNACFSILWSFQNWLIAFAMKFPPLSDQNVFILCSDYVSTSVSNSLNFSKQFPLDFNTYNQVFPEKSSMKVTKCLAPPMEPMEPITS